MTGKKIDVKHVAKLANLTISDEEEKLFEGQLSQILDYVSQLKSVDTSQVLPTSQVTGQVNRSHPDSPRPGLKLDVDYFRVPALFEND